MTKANNLFLADRITQLIKFEVLLLTQDLVLQFNKWFEEMQLEIAEPLFQAWVVLENATLPSEAQTVAQVGKNTVIADMRIVPLGSRCTFLDLNWFLT